MMSLTQTPILDEAPDEGGEEEFQLVEYDFGRDKVRLSSNGKDFENRYLYPKGAPVGEVSARQRAIMLQEIFEDKRPRADREAEMLGEVLDQNPYKKDPENISAEWLDDIAYLVREELGISELAPQKAKMTLIAAPCTNTRLDILCGIDCIFQYTHPVTGAKAFATVDLSLNLEGKQEKGFKADMVVTPTEAVLHWDWRSLGLKGINKATGNIDAPRWKDRRTQIAKAIAEILRHRLIEAGVVFRTPREMHRNNRVNMRGPGASPRMKMVQIFNPDADSGAAQ
jgi:hypothetical protein